jgi:Zn-dependent membrane protease YugP
MGLIIIGVIFAGIGMWVQSRLKKRFKEYSKIPIKSGLTGREVAEQMLRENGIADVQVKAAKGCLTDHYNPGHQDCVAQ